MLLSNELEYTLSDKGIYVYTDKGKIRIDFDPNRFRTADVPILMSDVEKIKKLGFKINFSLADITKDQLNYFLNKDNRV